MYFLVPLVDNRQARNGRAQRSDPLLPVDEDLLVRRDQAALERCTDRLPGNEVPDRVPVVKRV
jgi:hypothetical protein